jgi:hypothetical protein
MKRTKQLIMSFVALAVLGVGASARAQDNTTPPPSEPPPAAHSSSGNAISLSGGAGIGIGASLTLTGRAAGGLPAGQFVYDVALFHIEGLLGFFSQEVGPMNDRQTEWLFGVGGWYHLHRGSSSDFSLGAVIAIDTLSGGGGSATITSFEPGALARAFVTPNVAVFGRVGFGINFGDTGNGTQIGLGGQPMASFGFTYFFR